MRRRSVGRAAAAIVVVAVVAACGGGAGGDATSTPAPTITAPADTGYPGGAEPTDLITLNDIQPDDGIEAVIEVIDSAQVSLDLAFYEMDSAYTPLIEALHRAQDRGVAVRILISAAFFPLNGPNANPQVVADLQAQGFDAELSRTDVSFSHWKVIIVDAGTPQAYALVADYNLEPRYFGRDYRYVGQGETRGMGAINRDPQDVAMIAETFEADWPPFGAWPESDRPNLVWSPSSDICDSVSCASPAPLTPTGNSLSVMTALIDEATETLDIYVQALAKPSLLLEPLERALERGVAVRIVGNPGGINDDANEQLSSRGAQIIIEPADPNNDGLWMYIHTKTIVADGRTDRAVAYVGSVNPFLDESLMTERELGVLMTDHVSIERILATFDRDFSEGEPA